MWWLGGVSTTRLQSTIQKRVSRTSDPSPLNDTPPVYSALLHPPPTTQKTTQNSPPTAARTTNKTFKTFPGPPSLGRVRNYPRTVPTPCFSSVSGGAQPVLG